jgi:hypothetical protein
MAAPSFGAAIGHGGEFVKLPVKAFRTGFRQWTDQTGLCWLLLISSKKQTNLPLQLPGHVTPESHIKSREGEDPCSCSQKLLCRKAPICLGLFHGAPKMTRNSIVMNTQRHSVVSVCHLFSSLEELMRFGDRHDASLCWLLGTSVQKNQEMCQKLHEETTLSYWLHEPSPEKREGLISSGPSCFTDCSGRKARP